MRLVNTVKASTDPVSQLVGRQQAGRLNNGALAVHPLGLDRIEPRALARQITHQDAHALARAFGQLVVRTNPGAHHLADMPGGVVPNQGQDLDPLARQRLATPLQKVDRDRTHRPTIHEAQQHALLSGRMAWATDQNPVTRQSLRVPVCFVRFQFLQSQRRVGLGPGAQPGLRHPAPPHFVFEAQRPVGMGLGQPKSAGHARFFSSIFRIRAGDPLFGAAPANPQPLQRGPHRLGTDLFGCQTLRI